MIKASLKNALSINFETHAMKRAIADKMVDALKDATPVDTGEARDGWHVVDDGKTVSVQNKVDHIETLNEGHSEQAGTHFIEQTALSISGVIPNGVIVQTNPS